MVQRAVYRISDRELATCCSPTNVSKSELTDDLFDKGYPRNFYEGTEDSARIHQKYGEFVIVLRFVRVGEAPVRALPSIRGSKTNLDIWEDEQGFLFSNDPIPLLYGTPEHVLRRMPASQKLLVEKVEGSLKQSAKQKEAANKFAEEELGERVRRELQGEMTAFWEERRMVGGLDGWVGRVRIGSDIRIDFWHQFAWMTHGRKYAAAKDPTCAYLTNGSLFYIVFGAEDIDEAAKVGLRTIRDGDWVNIVGHFKNPNGSIRLPETSCGRREDGKYRFTVTGGSIGVGNCILRRIEPLAN